MAEGGIANSQMVEGGIDVNDSIIASRRAALEIGERVRVVRCPRHNETPQGILVYTDEAQTQRLSVVCVCCDELVSAIREVLKAEKPDEKLESTMPKSTQKAFEYLRLEVLGLHADWHRIFRPLFDGENAITFYDSAPNAYSVILWAMLDRMCLALTRLADPAKTKDRKSNMCLEYLISTLDKRSAGTLIKNLKKRLRQFRLACGRFKLRRDHWTAHRDLDTIEMSSKNPEPSFSRADVEKALMALRDFMNEIERYFSNSETSYQNVILNGDGERLIKVIKSGLDKEKQLFASLGLVKS